MASSIGGNRDSTTNTASSTADGRPAHRQAGRQALQWVAAVVVNDLEASVPLLSLGATYRATHACTSWPRKQLPHLLWRSDLGGLDGGDSVVEVPVEGVHTHSRNQRRRHERVTPHHARTPAPEGRGGE
eukprot:GHVU01167101.1.p2 GENE.GHVU01167101.1~~GHVU01167101.1.p2  ORF type:complete len:129 (-),score=3.78 GHVU01167101.1:187-573(-)